MSSPDPKELSKNQDLQDWIDALENLDLFDGTEHAKEIVNDFFKYAENKGFIDDFFKQIPFENTISVDEEEDYLMMSKLYDELYSGVPICLIEAMEWLNLNPSVASMNSNVRDSKINQKISNSYKSGWSCFWKRCLYL